MKRGRPGAAKLPRPRGRLPGRRGPDRRARCSRSRRWRCWTTGPTSTCSTRSSGAGPSSCSAWRCSACSTTRSDGARPRTRPAAGAATRAPCWPGGSPRARSRRRGRWRSPPTRPPGGVRRGCDYVADLALLLLATNLFNLLDLRPGRVEKVFVVLLAGLCIGGTTLEPLELRRRVRRPGAGGRRLHAARAGDARRHRLEPGRRPRRRRAPGDAGRDRAGWSRWGSSRR